MKAFVSVIDITPQKTGLLDPGFRRDGSGFRFLQEQYEQRYN